MVEYFVCNEEICVRFTVGPCLNDEAQKIFLGGVEMYMLAAGFENLQVVSYSSMMQVEEINLIRKINKKNK